MNHDALKSVIDAAWEIRDQLTQQTMGEIRDAVNTVLNQWWDKVPSKFDGWGAQNSKARASAPCPTASCAGPPISRPASC
jgi:hypothetical protein